MFCSYLIFSFFFFNDTATTEIYTLSLHDALPIYCSQLSDCESSHTPIELQGEELLPFRQGLKVGLSTCMKRKQASDAARNSHQMGKKSRRNTQHRQQPLGESRMIRQPEHHLRQDPVVLQQHLAVAFKGPEPFLCVSQSSRGVLGQKLGCHQRLSHAAAGDRIEKAGGIAE